MPTMMRRAIVGGMTTSALMTRYVYDFDEPADGGRNLLGGKGVGLAEMTQLGVPVPAGFTITTDACRAFMATGGAVDGLDAEVEDHIKRLEEKSGKVFGDTTDPLLVSVRSGAAISMPGMMDTILNLGLDDDAVEGLAASTGNPRFAYDSYRRLIQMYGEVVDGIDGHRFEQALGDLKRDRGVQLDVDLSADDLAQLLETFKHIYAQETGDGFPQDAREQLRRAVLGVFQSWENPRAQRLPAHVLDPGRHRHGGQRRPDGLRQPGRGLGDGCLLHARPVDRRAGVYGEYLVNAQGEDVVAGIRTPQPLEEMQERLPEAYAELLENDARGSSSTTATCRTSSSPSRRGTLYLLQTRSAKRTAAAAIKAAVEMTRRGSDQPRGGDRADRPGPARPAPPPDARPGARSSRSPHAA